MPGKMVYSLSDIRPSLPTLLPTTFTRSKHDKKFLQYQTFIDAYKYSFLPRTVIEWNDLPSEIVNSQSLDSFKQSLYSYYDI